MVHTIIATDDRDDAAADRDRLVLADIKQAAVRRRNGEGLEPWMQAVADRLQLWHGNPSDFHCGRSTKHKRRTGRCRFAVRKYLLGVWHKRPYIALSQGGASFRFLHQGSPDLLAQLHELDLADRRETCPCRNEMAHDDVFLEASETIHLAQGGGFGQNPRRVLE